MVGKSGSNLELFGVGHEVGHPMLGVSYQNNDTEGHATLAGRTKGGPRNGLDGSRPVGIGKECGMILGAQVALGSFSIRRGSGMNVFTHMVAPHKGNGLNGRSVTEKIHHGFGSMHNVEDTIGQARLLRQLRQHHGGTWRLFTGFQQEGIPRRTCHGKHPKRNHGRKVKGRNSRTDPQGHAIAHTIHATADTGQRFPHETVSSAAGGLDHFEAPKHIAPCIGQSLSLFLSNEVGQGIHVGFVSDQGLILQHDPLTLLDWHLAPTLKRLVRHLDRLLQFFLSRLGNPRHHLICRRIRHIDHGIIIW
mmetsp:Transcript_22684/g.40992  ORF Transcript_22684/g.40992 Transcript_22684/m.40992 type:complete len:305 (+) Transcript_22684:601-1515(+)